jgi:neutral ceramidase
MKPQAGAARTSLTPYWGVELTGWGYYLERTWQTVHDPLFATALVIDNGQAPIGIVSLDLMVIGSELTDDIRRTTAEATGLPAENILVCCTHTHNAPASQGLLGVGKVDPLYEQWAARQAATALIQAWRSRQEATLASASSRIEDLTFNRTRENGPVDPHLTALRVDRADGSPLAVVVGFQAHPTVTTVLRPRAVSRDVPGEVCDRIEQALPGCAALYIQGACGDVSFHRSFSDSEEIAKEPARRLAAATLTALENAQALDGSDLAAGVQTVRLPTRRWTREEIDADRAEALQRLRDRDLSGWRESIGRVMTTRPLEMVARHGGDEWKAVAAMCRFNQAWTERMLEDLDTRPEWLDTQIQALRIGELGIVSNASEFFTTLALEVRERVELPHLMLACYANGRIGYLPDAHDVVGRTYAAYQSPKYCNQFPFTPETGPVMVEAMSQLMNSLSGG